MEIHCTNCGAVIPNDGLFCPSCGARAPEFDASATMASGVRMPPPAPAPPPPMPAAPPPPAAAPPPAYTPPEAATVAMREPLPPVPPPPAAGMSRDPFAPAPAAPSRDPFAPAPQAPSRDPFAPAAPPPPSRDPFAAAPAVPSRDPFAPPAASNDPFGGPGPGQLPPPPAAGSNDPFARSTAAPHQPYVSSAPGGTSSLSGLWARIGSLELGIAAGTGALAFIFSLVALILEIATDAASESQFRGQVWENVAIALALGAVGWAVASREKLAGTAVLAPETDRYVLYGLAGGAVIFAIIGFIRTAGYDFVGDESTIDEQAWISFSFVWALLALGWALFTRQLEPALARKVALGLSGASAFFLLGGLVIGNTGDSGDAYNGVIRSSAWWGLALVLLTLSTAAILGRREDRAA